MTTAAKFGSEFSIENVNTEYLLTGLSSPQIFLPKQNKPMPNLSINRSFNASVVHPGGDLFVYYTISCPAPINPDINMWWTNFGDNLGGSTLANGPLDLVQIYDWERVNFAPSDHTYTAAGPTTGTDGCVRLWTQGSTYPQSLPTLREWMPFNLTKACKIKFTAWFRVLSTAVSGTVIGLPTRVSPTNNSNFNANEWMIDVGTGFTPIFTSGSVTII
jgi:hypothetical protein